MRWGSFRSQRTGTRGPSSENRCSLTACWSGKYASTEYELLPFGDGDRVKRRACRDGETFERRWLNASIASSDPFRHELGKFFVLVLVRKVAAVVEDMQPAPLDTLTKPFPIVEEQQLILGAPEQQHWSLNGVKLWGDGRQAFGISFDCLLYTSPSPRDKRQSRMPSSA